MFMWERAKRWRLADLQGERKPSSGCGGGRKDQGKGQDKENGRSEQIEKK